MNTQNDRSQPMTKKDLVDWVLANNANTSVCTDYADLAATSLPNCRRVGFWNMENPGAEVAPDCDGHDFAIVNGRYIVDGWRLWVNDERPFVFDLHAESDREEISRLYGRPDKWEWIGEH